MVQELLQVFGFGYAAAGGFVLVVALLRNGGR